MFTKTRGHHHHSHASSNVDVKVEPAEQSAPASHNVGKDERSDLIQVRAYGLWEHAGRPHSDASRERFWCEAEKEIMASQGRDE